MNKAARRVGIHKQPNEGASLFVIGKDNMKKLGAYQFGDAKRSNYSDKLNSSWTILYMRELLYLEKQGNKIGS